MENIKPIRFLGDSLDKLCAFPLSDTREAGYQIDRVENGLEPDNWEPLGTGGRGVVELRIRDAAGTVRVIYIAELRHAVYVLHCLQQKEAPRHRIGIDFGALFGFFGDSTLPDGQRFDRVWDAVESTPEDAEIMKLRSALMMALRERVTDMLLDQPHAVQVLGATQPRFADLMRGKINRFSLDTLVGMATAAGLRVELQIIDAG